MNYQILVNKDNKYEKQDFQNEKLVSYTNSLGEEIILERRTLQAFLNLQKEFTTDIKLDIDSGYRSLEEQDEINNLYKEYAAPSGFSEHHTGLAFDLFLIDKDKNILENKEMLSDKYIDFWKKVEKKAYRCGLILRYPKDKESVTGYTYEPWHYRYVTTSTAKIIHDKKLTLEEYHKLYRKSGILLVNKKKE